MMLSALAKEFHFKAKSTTETKNVHLRTCITYLLSKGHAQKSFHAHYSQYPPIGKYKVATRSGLDEVWYSHTVENTCNENAPSPAVYNIMDLCHKSNVNERS